MAISKEPRPLPIPACTGFLFLHPGVELFPEGTPAEAIPPPRSWPLAQQIAHFKLVLIKKNRPDFLAGLFTGPGGKLEEKDTIYSGMAREFHEEAGMWFDGWRRFLTFGTSHNMIVHFFYGFADFDRAESIRSMTDEQVFIIPLGEILAGYHACTENLRWQVGMALAVASGRSFDYQVRESGGPRYEHISGTKGFESDESDVPF